MQRKARKSLIIRSIEFQYFIKCTKNAMIRAAYTILASNITLQQTLLSHVYYLRWCQSQKQLNKPAKLLSVPHPYIQFCFFKTMYCLQLITSHASLTFTIKSTLSNFLETLINSRTEQCTMHNTMSKVAEICKHSKSKSKIKISLSVYAITSVYVYLCSALVRLAK